MRPDQLTPVLLLLSLSLITPFAIAQEPRFVPAESLTIEGRGFTDTAATWGRLPAGAQESVRPPVWNLSRHSAGLVVRFRSDTDRIELRYALTSASLDMPHMPATGVSGFDLYARVADGWRWVAATKPAAQEERTVLVEGLPRESREFALYLPLYNGVDRLELAVATDAALEAAPGRADERPIVFYGTSITQGACASRPGACHVAILGRRLDRHTVNLGFSGQGRMDMELADLLGKIDAAVYVIDCLPNMDVAQVRDRALPFLRRLRAARPDVPIVLVEDRTLPRASLVPELMAMHQAERDALRSAMNELVETESGSGPILLVPGDELLGEDGEATVDGSHPTDLGFVRMADALEPALRTALRLGAARAR